jgi:hypothetical protein
VAKRPTNIINAKIIFRNMANLQSKDGNKIIDLIASLAIHDDKRPVIGTGLLS